MSTEHRPSCAKRWRDQAVASGWPIAQAVLEIHNCCGVSLLRAQRLARGWTLDRAAQECRELCAREGLPARGDAEQLGGWEIGKRQPRSTTVDVLCRIYRTDSQGLGLIGDYRDGDTTRHVDSHSYPTLNSASSPSRMVGERKDRFGERIDFLRRIMDRTLAAGTVNPTQMDLLEERIHLHAKQYIHTPPQAMLRMLLPDLEEVQVLANDRQPAAVQARLSEMTALMAILMADALMKLGRLPQARAWFATAHTAADDSGSLELRARVRAQAAMLPYYYGPVASAVRLARDARMLFQRASATAALAAAAEARALARLGDGGRAEKAIKHARIVFERSPQDRDDDDAFAFPERRMLLYLSGAHTFLGQNRQARDMQQQALALYTDRAGIDPALLRLEAAICLAREHSVSEACELAGAAYLQVPEAHRTPILGARARHVIEVIPPAMRSRRATRELDEILALPSGQA